MPNVVGAGLSFFLRLLYFNRERELARVELVAEQSKSEALLLDILPEPIAERLKGGEQVIAHAYSAVTVMFVHIVGFTSTTAHMQPSEVPGRIQVTERVHDLLKESYDFESRGDIEVKGEGPMRTYFLDGRRFQAGLGSVSN